MNCDFFPEFNIRFSAPKSREMLLVCRLFIVLYCLQYIHCNILDLEYEEIAHNILFPPTDRSADALPVNIGRDKVSGCICRGTKNSELIVCFGNYECKRFPQVKVRSRHLIVRTTVLPEIRVGDLDSLYYLTSLKIESNHKLKYLQPRIFRNLTKLRDLSISYNTDLRVILNSVFEGLISLRELKLVNNGFTNIFAITSALKPAMLPSLKKLDLSENSLEKIPEKAFKPMVGSTLETLCISLCRIDFIHPDSFIPLKMLQDLSIGENDLNSSIINDFLVKLQKHGINLRHLDLSGIGFRKHPPKKLLETIANTTIERLTLADNQFEIIADDTFPKMKNIKVLDLRRVSAISMGPKAFEPLKFPSLRILLLSGNHLPGIHLKHIANQQILLMDLSSNKGTASSPFYYEIDRGAFEHSGHLRILNLAFNRMKSIFDYTFTGLGRLKMLNLENGTIFHIGNGTFKPLKNLEILNLANNPLAANENLTSAMFDGLNMLKILILKNCGIKYFYEDDNIFETMPNLTHLILRNNELYFITSELFKPLKNLQELDLSDNLILSWWRPVFYTSGIRPHSVFLADNKISHFTLNMMKDINYLLENKGNFTVEIDLMDNVFICDCPSMYNTYTWLQVNGSEELKIYFAQSTFLCSSPDVWEDRRVADYLLSIKTLNCLMFDKFSNLMLMVWTAPSIIMLIIVLLIVAVACKYRLYIRYWLFLAKIALGRKFIRKSLKNGDVLERADYKYDAFVSYCNEDREFVAEMITQLECTPPYLKLCIYERDFEIGSFISESILGSINVSRYIILIISNHFAKSQWCRWETQLAEYHRLFLEDGTSYDPLVLIRIGDVENKYLTTTLKFLMKTKIYITWGDQQPNEFWKKLRNVICKYK
ncbi:protein artichoke-like [Danaus plexippus]|uniref:protein artichoke-like n=1 Tax=Danaus plexippus TaxID=13037 RepID=UPI002AB0D0EF|nr:protein artichoke-like [Danaus plexippus]